MDVYRVYRIALIISLMAWGALELWRLLRDRRSGESDSVDRDRNSVWVMNGLSVFAVVAAVVVAPQTQGAVVLPWRNDGLEFAFGMLLVWAGLGLRLWAIRALGGFFNSRVVIRDEHPVVSGGPYRYLRHPSYTGALMTGIGVGVLLGNWISLVILVLLPLAGYLYRIRVEESALTSSLGEPYAKYARSTRRLVPFVW
jgi:protein-S-isoprenylcysteine O-methyltransferase Ste14